MKIKRILPAIILLISLPVFGNNIDKLFSDYSKVSHAEHVKINKFLTNVLKPFVSEFKGIDSMEVIDLDDCPDYIKNNLDNEIRDKVFFNGYETLIKENDGNHTSIVLIKVKNNAIREMVVINTGNDHELVRIKGNFDKKHIRKLIDKHQ